MRTSVLIVLLFAFFLGCSSKQSFAPSVVTLTPYNELPQQETLYKLHHETPVTLTIYEQYKKWVNTPYAYGGESCKGIDCSALVQTVYQDGFGISVPRDTEHQARIGHFVEKSQIKEGDLLLFKTGFTSKHSGIYLELGNFLHTSSKHGVTISNLNNPYWREKYSQARRVLTY